MVKKNLLKTFKEQKMKDLSKMEEYVYTIKPRMEYLCRYLDCEEPIPQVNCDNTNLDSYEVNPNSAFKNVLEKFYELHYIPDLDMAEHTQGTITIDGIKTYLTIKIPYPNTVRVIRNSKLVGEYKDMIKRSDFTALEAHKLLEMIKAHKRDKSHIINGVAAAYYGISNVGTIIHRCKYEGGGDFPETLLKSTLRAFKKKLGEIHFDLVVYVPPTHSGDLVKNFATKFASVIKVPISHQLKKIRITEEQKIFQNRLSKQDNVNGAFAINEDVKNKNIILIDDIYDSGETLKEIARILTAKGARYIAPVVIAKTVGGTL